MSRIFLEILNNSIMASYLILAVILLRVILKKTPKWSVCLLWGMVAVRLLIPISLESAFSVIPASKPITVEEFDAIKSNTEDSILKEQETNNYFNSEVWESIADEKIPGENSIGIDSDSEKFFKEHLANHLGIISGIWLMGMTMLLTYAVLSFTGLKRKVAASICLYDNVYICDEIDSPFVLGIVKPRIYLSSQTPSEVWEPILKHERGHLGRGDHIWKLLGFFLVAIYWFNPLSWVAYILFCKDMELACDEKATKDMDKKQRADYCQALLACSMNQKLAKVCPVAFGEVGVKERIKQVLNYKKPSFWMILLAVIVCVVVSVCFMTNPKSQEEGSLTNSENGEATSDVTLGANGQEKIESTTEYDHIEADERGYRWLSEEVYIYELEDLDQNGVEEYVEVYHAENEPEYFCRFTFYWNGEAIYEYDDPCRIFPGNAEYLDLDGDGQKEVFFPFYPAVNSMPLVEYIVLKQKADLSWKPLEMIHGETLTDNAFPISIAKGKNEWEAVISCGDLEKEIVFDLKNYYLKLKEIWEKDESEGSIVSDYKCGFPEKSEWYTFGSVCAWGIWNITSGEYQGQPCLIATHGIQGYDKFDLWGELDVYFNYDEQGKTRFLNMEFRNSESWDDTGQQTKKEFTMEDLIALCDAGNETLKNVMTNFSEEGELPYSNFEKNVSDFSLTWDYFCNLSYEGREYRLQVSYWKPEEAEEYGYKPNELEGLWISYPATGDMKLLYITEGFKPNLDIRTFLEKEYDLGQYVELKLPDGLELENYRVDMTLGQGCLFAGDYEEIPHGDFTPEDWYAPGGIEFIQKEYFPGDIKFESDKLKEVVVHMNHSGITSEFEVLEGCEMQAVLCEYSCDLFTIPEAEEYKQKHGISEEEFQWNSNYWYVFFTEWDSEYMYVLFLNQEYFDKEDIVELARSVEFKVK